MSLRAHPHHLFIQSACPQAEASQYGICIVRAPVAPTTPGGLVSAADA